MNLDASDLLIESRLMGSDRDTIAECICDFALIEAFPSNRKHHLTESGAVAVALAFNL
jgi:hypothetical protein